MTAADRIYLLLEAAAERGDPCPTNASMAEAIDVSAANYVAHAMKQLQKAGRITVTRDRHQRLVTITATGKSTTLTNPDLTSRRDDAWRARREIAKDEMAERVANGETIANAGKALGLSGGSATRLWAEVVQGLGWVG